MEDSKIFLGALEIENDNVKQYLCNSFENNKESFIRDLYDIENNKIIKRIGKNILTGDEEWRYDSETKTFAYYQENKFNINGLGKYDKMMSNYFRWQTFNKEIKESMFQGNDKGEIMFRFYDKVNEVDVFKTWLKKKYLEGKPVEVYFALQYPIVIKKEKVYNWCCLHNSTREFGNIIFENSEGIAPIVNIKNRIYNREK